MIIIAQDNGNKKIDVAVSDEWSMQGKTYILEDDGVDILDYTSLPGTYTLKLSDGKMVIVLVDLATAIKVAGNALFTITVTTDTKVNIYVDSGKLKVENKTGSTVTYTIAKTSGIA